MYYFAIFAFLTGMLNLFLGIYSYSVSAKRNVNVLFLILNLLLSLWSLFYSFVYISPTKEYAWILYKISSVGWVFFAPFLLHFTILLRYNKYPFKKISILFLYLPSVIFQLRILFGYLLTIDLTHNNLGWIHVFNKSDIIWIYSFVVFLLLYVIFSIYNVYRYGKESVYKSQKKQANALLISAFAVTVFGTLSDIFVPRFVENQTVPAMANIFTSIWVVGATIAVVRYKFMVLTANIASETILEKIKDLIILFSPQYRILEINKQVEELLGYTNEELHGKKINILFENKFQIDFELVKLNSKDVQEIKIEKKLLSKDNIAIPVSASISVIRDKRKEIIGCVFIAHDLRNIYQLKEEIEERTVLTEELKNSELKFKEFLEYLPLSVAEVSLQREVVYLNETVLKLFGYRKEEIDIDFNILKVVHPKDHFRLTFNYSKSVLKKNKDEEVGEYLGIRKDGSTFPMIIHTNKILKNNKIIALRVIFIDITEQKNYEESLKKAKEFAELADKAKSTFIANTSHEIRTPINAIIGYTNLLLKQDLSQQQLKYIKNIKTSGDNLLGIINDILDHSKIQNIKLEIQNVEFEIKKVIESIVNAINIKAEEKNISLILHFDNSIPNILIGDPVRIGQILNNLIGNAIKFTNSGGLVNVNVLLSREIIGEVELRFIVEDTGIGIAEDKFESIFESFNQVDYNTTRKYGGTGLGLSIVKQLVEAHNSKINVSSEVGKGTKFSFNIVFRKSTSEFLVVEKEQNQINTCNEHPLNIKILLAEDNVTNREIVIDTIHSWKNTIQIDVAENGKVAIEKLQTTNYDILLLDIQMPEMDGYDVAKYVRNNMELPNKNIPIFAMTANTMKEEIKKCTDLGMNEYFSKPFSPEDLYNKIKLYTCVDIVEKRRQNDVVDYTCLYCKAEFKSKEIILKNQTETMLNNENKLYDLSHFEKIYKNDYSKIKVVIAKIIDEIPLEIIELNKAIETENWQKIKTHSHTIKTKMLYIGAVKSNEISKEIEILSSKEQNIEIIQKLKIELEQNWNEVKQELNNVKFI